MCILRVVAAIQEKFPTMPRVYASVWLAIIENKKIDHLYYLQRSSIICNKKTKSMGS